MTSKQPAGFDPSKPSSGHRSYSWLLAAFLLLFLWFLFPADPYLTTDSMEYLARGYAEYPDRWAHPHHLLWVPVLHGAERLIGEVCRWMDAVRSAQIFMAAVSAWGVMALGLVLRRRGRLSALAATLWAAALALCGGYSELARETESYNAAVALCLSSVLVLPVSLGLGRTPVAAGAMPDGAGADRTGAGASRSVVSPFARRLRWTVRMLIGVGLYVGAVCVHQLFALMALPFVMLFWRPGDDARRLLLGAGVTGLAGLLCLAAYYVAFWADGYAHDFVQWMTLYSGEMPLFGKVEHFAGLYFLNRLVANLMAAVGADVVPLIKAAAEQGVGAPLLAKATMGVGYIVWLVLWVAAFAGVCSRRPLYRFFAWWYVSFEVFLWYWAPWLLQMQVLLLPAALGVLAFGGQALAERLCSGRLQRTAPIWLAAAAVLFVSGARLVVGRERLGHHTLDEAQAFYANYDSLSTSDAGLMLLYGYGQSRAYVILAGDLARERIIVVDDREDEELKWKREIKIFGIEAGDVLAAGGPVLIHKSMLLSDGGECKVRLLAEHVRFKNRALRLVGTPDGLPVALEITPAVPNGADADLIKLQAHDLIREMAQRAVLDQDVKLCADEPEDAPQ